jgi:O-antigen/teichoic acid export membrane protein
LSTHLPGDLVRPGALSVVDQAMLSATTFVIGLVLARFTTPGNYGAWALAVGVQLVLGGIQSAVVITPLTILGAPRTGDDLRRWVSALLAGQVAVSLCFTVLLATASVAVGRASTDPTLSRALAGLSVAILFVHAQEFCRRVLFLRLAAGRVLLNDLVYCSLQVVGVTALWALDRRSGTAGEWLSAGNIFLATAAAALAGTMVGLWQARELLSGRRLIGARALLREAWEMGRFNLGGQVGSTILLYANRFVAAAFGGTVGVAMLEAPRLLVAPLHVVSISAGSVTTPRAAVAYATGGRKALLGFLVPVAALWTGGFLAYALVVAVAPGFWLQLFYGDKFKGTETILVLWCLCYAISGLRVLPASALKVVRHYRVVMWSSLTAGCVMVAAALVLCPHLGVEGVVLGRLTGDIVLLALLVAAFVKWVWQVDGRS